MNPYAMTAARQRSRQPALAAAVEFDVAVAFAAGGGQTEIEFLDVLVLAQRGRLAIHDDPAVFQDVAVIGIAQRDIGVLLGDDKADAGLLVEPGDDLEDLLDQLRREAERGFIEQYQPRPRHQRPASATICCSPPEV